MMRFVALLLIALAVGFCAPESSGSASRPLAGISSHEAQITPSCDGSADDLGVTIAKTSFVALDARRSDTAPADPEASAVASPYAASAPHQIALDVPASRAPPVA